MCYWRIAFFPFSLFLCLMCVSKVMRKSKECGYGSARMGNGVRENIRGCFVRLAERLNILPTDWKLKNIWFGFLRLNFCWLRCASIEERWRYNLVSNSALNMADNRLSDERRMKWNFDNSAEFVRLITIEFYENNPKKISAPYCLFCSTSLSTIFLSLCPTKRIYYIHFNNIFHFQFYLPISVSACLFSLRFT